VRVPACRPPVHAVAALPRAGCVHRVAPSMRCRSALCRPSLMRAGVLVLPPCGVGRCVARRHVALFAAVQDGRATVHGSRVRRLGVRPHPPQGGQGGRHLAETPSRVCGWGGGTSTDAHTRPSATHAHAVWLGGATNPFPSPILVPGSNTNVKRRVRARHRSPSPLPPWREEGGGGG
jgi:hypothetical protein